MSMNQADSLDTRVETLLATLDSAPDAALRTGLGRLLQASDYAWSCLAQDGAASRFLASERLRRASSADDYAALLAGAADVADEQAFMRRLRQLRREEMLRWIYRDVNGFCAVPELTRELSDFADAAIALVLARAHAELAAVHGEPVGERSGAVQRMCVIAMGKLGARELNLSSDIDLIFTYPEAGETAGPRVVSNQEFFVRLGQKIIQLLDTVTGDGFVFRVDMRLRPWGDGAALASSFAAMETYYEQHGREWER